MVKFRAIARRECDSGRHQQTPVAQDRRQLDRPAQFARQWRHGDQGLSRALRRREANRSVCSTTSIVKGASDSSADSATNQIAPSSGATPLTVAQRLTGGAPPAAAASPSAAPQTAAAKTLAAFRPRQQRLERRDVRRPRNRRAPLPASKSPTTPPTIQFSFTPSAENYQIIQRTLDQLDRPKLQVAIDVTIAEVTLDNSLNYGVQFFLANIIQGDWQYGNRQCFTTSPPSIRSPA